MKIEKWKSRKVLINLLVWDPTYWMTNVGKLIRRLEQLGADVHVFCQETDLIQNLREEKRIKVISYTVPWLRTMSFMIALVQYRFDLVLWTYSSYRENFLLAIARVCRLLPFVIKSDSLIIERPSRIFKWILRRADLIIVETLEVEKWTKKWVSGQNIVSLPTGVPVSEFQRMEEMFLKEKSSDSRPFFLFTGRICHEKGLDQTLESFSLVASSIPEWDLHIVGPVRDQIYFQKCLEFIVEKKLQKRIAFHDFTTGQNLCRWYHKSDIFLLSSRLEGLANRIPEAMFFKNPIIAFDVGQTASLIDDSVGALIPQNRIDLFAEAMKTLALNDTLRKSKGAAAQARTISNLNDDLSYPNLINLCSNLLK